MADEAREVHDEPAQPTQPSRRRLRRARLAPIVAAAILVGVLLVVLLVLWLSGEQVTGLVFPTGVDAAKIEVDARTFRSYFTVERKLAGPRGRTLILTLKRTKSYPLKDSDIETLAERVDRAFSAFSALHAVGVGYVRCEYFNKKGKFLDFRFERIKDLVEREEAELTLPIGDYKGVQRIVLTY